MVEREGERFGTVAMRKFAVRYLTGIPGARVFRDHITRAETTAEFREVVERFFPEEAPPGAQGVTEELCAPL
jgi:tRNA-dihydrouridine synthase